MTHSIKKLGEKDIDKKFQKLSGWVVNAKKTEITKTFQCASFMGGFTFLAKVAVHAEVIGHHPTIELSYSKVKIKLSTNDVKGLTTADFELAKKIDSLRIL